MNTLFITGRRGGWLSPPLSPPPTQLGSSNRWAEGKGEEGDIFNSGLGGRRLESAPLVYVCGLEPPGTFASHKGYTSFTAKNCTTLWYTFALEPPIPREGAPYRDFGRQGGPGGNVMGSVPRDTSWRADAHRSPYETICRISPLLLDTTYTPTLVPLYDNSYGMSKYCIQRIKNVLFPHVRCFVDLSTSACAHTCCMPLCGTDGVTGRHIPCLVQPETLRRRR